MDGIRILNERIEEYDKRFDAIQQSTQKFFVEVQAETSRRDTVICQALDNMHEKIISEVAAKFDHPNSPNTFASPKIMSPRTPSALNPGAIVQINNQLDN